MATEIIKVEKISRDAVELRVHPRSISKMRGMTNNNVETLKRRFQLQSLKIVPDASLAEDSLSIS
jgi:hypothetical protein